MVIDLLPKKISSLEVHHFPSGSMNYVLKRSTERKTISVCVDAMGRLSVSCPRRVSRQTIDHFLDEKASWIVEKVRMAAEKMTSAGTVLFDHGQDFLFLGKRFPLDSSVSDVVRPRLRFTGAKWLALLPRRLSDHAPSRQAAIRKILLAWYRSQAGEILGVRVFHYSRVMNITPRKINVRAQKRMWGCCHFHEQTISLNWQLVMAPLRVIDYVVIHEMCHLWIPDHSKHFWNKVREFMPDYESARDWLKTHQLSMTLCNPAETGAPAADNSF
jgi:predicted metal-dependent hydrolase